MLSNLAMAQVEKKHTLMPNVHIMNESFDMPQLGRQRRIWIYLPPGYETSKKKYPVIYMQDGQNLFDEFTTAFGQEWGVDEAMNLLPPGQQQAIIVGIDHGGEYRITEYDPYDSKYGKGQGDLYARFLVETLKPYIDSHYKTLTAAKHTTIAGSSMGALISMYAAVKYPNVFGNAGIFSASFWIAPQLYDYAKANADKKTHFYFVCGDSESEKEVSDMQKMADILKAKGLREKNIPVMVIKGAKHNEQQWRGDFPLFYDWLMMKK
jgi:alpha-glucosidase